MLNVKLSSAEACSLRWAIEAAKARYGEHINLIQSSKSLGAADKTRACANLVQQTADCDALLAKLEG